MGDNTGIEWTDATWNPVTGCSKVSQGCKFCYAERVFPRAYGADRAFTDVRTHPDRLDQPLRWKRPRRIFVNSMSDLFHEKLPSEFIAKILAVVGDCPRHTFQVLTKRPERMREIMRDLCAFAGIVEPPKNLWLGVSVEDQATADERIPLLLQTPAAVRFVSYEPALGPVDFRCLQHNREFEIDSLTGDHGVHRPLQGRSESKLSWIIAGGESGPRARPSHPDWFRSVRDQCAAAGVPFFFKQWGEWAEVDGGHPNRVFDVDKAHCPIDRLNRVIALDGHVPKNQEEMAPDVKYRWVSRIGKRRAGRLLDGREHSEFPNQQEG